MADNVTPFPTRKRVPEGRTLHVVQSYEKPGACDHRPENNIYYVDEAANTVECGKCKATLNPMWVMLQLANREAHWYLNWQRYAEMAAEYRKRSRTKCRHCGKMTELR